MDAHEYICFFSKFEYFMYFLVDQFFMTQGGLLRFSPVSYCSELAFPASKVNHSASCSLNIKMVIPLSTILSFCFPLKSG
jgi:hypothetical protein